MKGFWGGKGREGVKLTLLKNYSQEVQPYQGIKVDVKVVVVFQFNKIITFNFILPHAKVCTGWWKHPLQYSKAVKGIHCQRNKCFFNIKPTDSKRKVILNLGWKSSLYFNKKYLTTSNRKRCGMFAYRQTTRKVGITVFPSRFLSHLLRKYILSLI